MFHLRKSLSCFYVLVTSAGFSAATLADSLIFTNESSAESFLIGSSFVENSYWQFGIDLYKPVSRSADAKLFQSGSLQAKGDFDEKDPDIGVSVYRHWGPWFTGMMLAVPTSSSERAIRTRLHGGSYPDTTLKLRRGPFGTLMIGYSWNPLRTASLSFASMESLSLMRDMSFALSGGVKISRNELELKSDETNGGGVPEKFDDTSTDVEPVIKAAIGVPVTPMTDVELSLMHSRMPGNSVKGASSSFGFPYKADMDSGWQTDLTFGVKVRF